MSLPRRVSLLLIFLGIVLLCALGLSFSGIPDPQSMRTRMNGYWNGPQGAAQEPIQKEPIGNFSSASDDNDDVVEPADCTDPYRQPGYWYLPKSYKESTWIPFTSSIYDLPDPSTAAYPASAPGPIFHVSQPEDEVLNARPESHMATLLSEIKAARSDNPPEQPTPGSWLRNRRILAIGDSVDRFMIQFLCEEAGHKMTEPERHTTADCHIPELNFTMTHWHFPGNYPLRPDWWWMDQMKYVAFEERMEKLWSPTIPNIVGTNGKRPDLILWQANLWDQRTFWEAGAAKYGKGNGLGSRERQLAWEEIRFVMARMKKFVSLIDETFGTGIPIMYRTGTIHQKAHGDASIFELDRVSRFIAAQHSHEIFEWGRITTLNEPLYMDNTHLGKGAASWLYMNMALSYVKRGLEGWDTCHNQNLGWGGR